MICIKCGAPVWTASSVAGGKSHWADVDCRGRLRTLTPDEAKQAKAAITTIIGDGKDPTYS